MYVLLFANNSDTQTLISDYQTILLANGPLLKANYRKCYFVCSHINHISATEVSFLNCYGLHNTAIAICMMCLCMVAS